jgi:hypothetical protein
MEAQEIIERIQAMVERRNFALERIEARERELSELSEYGSISDVQDAIVALRYLKGSVAMWDIRIEFEMKQLHREHKSVLEALGVS